jgi:leucyl-tRNA synthetase
VEYDFKTIEEKWQKRWNDSGVFNVDVKTLKDKFYILTMFPYPSGDRLHMGHWYQYGIMDTWGRFQRMLGKGVFQPMGYDAFGLPAENFAIKKGIHPDVSTSKNVAIMTEQFKRMGVIFDWRYMLNTSKPDYYKWTQWLFLKLYEKGLAYRKEAPVNWCSSCQTVLANEQVLDGRCERCSTEVIRKNLEQWFFKITAYADKLLNGIEALDWPGRTKIMQTHWIGRSEGAEIDFKIVDSDQSFTVFTTRPDTLFGVTYVVLAPEHPLVEKITSKAQLSAVKNYIAESQKLSEIERLSTEKEKTGVFSGAYAINPVNQEKVPIWVADYVLFTYGTGAVMAVPGHDERDFAFAKTYKLPIRKVILESGTDAKSPLEKAFTDVGTVMESGSYNGQQSDAVIPKIIEDLEKQKKGIRKINFRLRDWLISRQRYWGTPIPIVYCQKCGEVGVPESDLPVKLPENVDFKPTGESPLKRCDEFINTKCPKCSGPAKREADTLDTFVCSSWYYLRFPNVGDSTEPFSKELTNKILPVDRYCGGPEHACMHLLYARFINMVLHDLGYVNFAEPFPHLTHQGLVLGPDGHKMSKSKGNSVSPDPYVEEHGSDILRLYLLFGFNYVDGGPWEDSGFKALTRFVDRLWRLFESSQALLLKSPIPMGEFSQADKKLLYRFHYTIKMVTLDTERFMFNTSIARMMELYNDLSDYLRLVPEKEQNQGLLQKIIRTFNVLVAPFAPHIGEEWWEKSGNKNSVFLESWPTFDAKYLSLDEIPMAVMINGKVREQISVPADATEEQVKAIALTQEKVRKYTDASPIVKQIFVPKKLINFIVK